MDILNNIIEGNSQARYWNDRFGRKERSGESNLVCSLQAERIFRNHGISNY
jgi:hypothetical protein